MSLPEATSPPSQSAINGALDLYVEGGQRDDLNQMLVGLAVLRHATEAQINAATAVVQSSRQLPEGSIQRMLESYGDTPSTPHLRAPSAPSTPAERNWDNEGGAQFAPATAPSLVS